MRSTYQFCVSFRQESLSLFWAALVGAIVLFGTHQAAGADASTSANYVADVPRATGMVDLGPAAGSATIHLGVMLTYRNVEAMDDLAMKQITPGSPLFHHFLSNAQFNEMFAATPAQYARVIAVLKTNGFQITQTFSNFTRVDAVGSVGAANSLFNTTIHELYGPSLGRRYANRTPAQIPPSLRGLILSVDGLDDLSFYVPNRLSNTATGRATRSIAAPCPTPPERGTYFGPADFAQAYLFPGQSTISNGQSHSGTGLAAGIVVDGEFDQCDIQSFMATYGVARTSVPRPIAIDNGANNSSLEATMDVEALASLAPGADLYVYEFPHKIDKQLSPCDLTDCVADAYAKVVADNYVAAVSTSFAICETDSSAHALAWDILAQQGSMKGITFAAASGDSGAAGLGSCKAERTVTAPSSGLWDTAVGGTALNINQGNWASETVWNFGDGLGNVPGAGGGGVSVLFGLPSWQKGVANLIPSGRNVPDVSMDAGNAMNVLFENQWTSNGGTSLSTPLFTAGIIAVDQKIGKRLGHVAPLLYKLFAQRGYGIDQPYFHDLTSYGANQCNSYLGVPGFCSTPGYDQATGLGSPVFDNLLAQQQSFQTVYQFNGPEFEGLHDGLSPQAGLLSLGGVLYGTTAGGGTYNCGTLFELIPPLIQEKLHDFECGTADANNPRSTLVADKYGTIYGTTYYGGAYSRGTVYKFENGLESVIYSFGGSTDSLKGLNPAAGLINVDGVLYGTTTGDSHVGYGTVFSMTTAGIPRWQYFFHPTQFSTDAEAPNSALLNVNGKLFGTSYRGGTAGAGTVYNISTAGSGESVVYNFGVKTGDATYPAAPVIDVNGELYGTTNSGGASGHGAVFEMGTSGEGEKLLYSVSGGLTSPNNSGLLYFNSALYGAASGGGTYDCGYFYRLTLPGGIPKILQNFNQYSIDGGYPRAIPINVNGTLYGTTSIGGYKSFPNPNGGTVFSFKP